MYRFVALVLSLLTSSGHSWIANPISALWPPTRHRSTQQLAGNHVPYYHHRVAIHSAVKPSAHETNTTIINNNIYSMPALYDLAFGYRDYEAEVNFLLQTHHQLVQRPVERVLELAAGPARHSLTALSSSNDDAVKQAVAVDTSLEMAVYANELADELLSRRDSHCFEYQVQDMRDSLPIQNHFDSAWILLGSLQHMTTNHDVMACFESVWHALKDEGTLILELPHPSETFAMVDCTRNEWNVPLEDEKGKESGTLAIVWGDQDDEFDPIQQVRQFTVAMELTDSDGPRQSVRQVVPMRLFTAQEIDALAQCSGFQVAQMYGALEEGVPVDDEDLAFRLVCVLQKTGSTETGQKQ